MGAVEELVKKSGGCAVIDGGFATQLEALGADINDPLWSAACLISKPHLVKEVTTARRPPNQRACKCLVVCSPWQLASRHALGFACTAACLQLQCMGTSSSSSAQYRGWRILYT
jgi:hypothetical protein